MPFKSKKQETYLKINEPKVYKKWKRDYESGGVNLEIPGGNLNLTESDVTATVQDDSTWAQLNKPLWKGDASILVEQELNVTDDGRVSLKGWDREGTGGAGAELTFHNENLNVTAGRSNKENYIRGQLRMPFNEGGYQPLNRGGMAGCPMDGAAIKGGTAIKPDRYKNGKRKV